MVNKKCHAPGECHLVSKGDPKPLPCAELLFHSYSKYNARYIEEDKGALGVTALGVKAEVNVDQLVELLVKNAAAELTTYYYYTILRVNLTGLEGEGIKEIAEVARIEDRNHFEALVLAFTN